MSKRFAAWTLALTVGSLAALTPLAAWAEDSTPPATPLPSSANYSLSPSQTPAAAAPDGLGPSASSSAPAGGSNADAGALQPAGSSPLQSTATDAGGLTAPNQNALQAPATTNDTLRVLLGEADGTTHQFADDTPTSNWAWLWFTLAFAAIAAVFYVTLRRYPKLLPVGRLAQLLARHRNRIRRR